MTKSHFGTKNIGKELPRPSWQLKIKPLPIGSWPGGSIIRRVRRGGNHRGRHRGDGQSPQRRRHDVGQHNGPRAALLPLGQVGWLENTCPSWLAGPELSPDEGVQAPCLLVASAQLYWLAPHSDWLVTVLPQLLNNEALIFLFINTTYVKPTLFLRLEKIHCNLLSAT